VILTLGVIGWVQQWGVVDEYEHGYRSQYVRIESLIDLTDDWGFKYGWIWRKLEGPTIRTRMQQYRNRVHEQAARLGVPVVEHG
jgi:hypothetical protein